MAVPPSRSGETVIVASKLPNRHTLVLCEKYIAKEPVLGGGVRDVEMWRPNPNRTVILNGTGVVPNTERTWQMTHGYALTPGVPADFWAEWLKQNRGCDLLTEGIIFAHTKTADVQAAARDARKIKTGLEPINPNETISMGDGMAVKADERMGTIAVEPVDELV